MTKIIVAICAALVSAIVAYGMSKARSAALKSIPPTDEAGLLVFRYSWGYVLFFVGFTIFLAVLADVPPEVGWGAPLGPKVFVASTVSLLGLTLLAIVGVLEFAFVQVRVGEHGLASKSPWTGERFIAWSDIDAVSYSAFGQWFAIRATSGQVIRAPLLLSGIALFAELLRQRVPPAKVHATKGFAMLSRWSGVA